MERKYVITIGRQLGSGGRIIGEKLASKLGISFYDKELIQIASQESGLGREFFERADEKRPYSVSEDYSVFGAQSPKSLFHLLSQQRNPVQDTE